VDPHLFRFPYEKFQDGSVELRDFYAPFLVGFEYGTDEDLKAMANDDRVRDRAMFASIFGDSSSTKMWKVRKAFEDNFHTTAVNTNVFDEESGNFPFGGYSDNASSATVLRLNDDRTVDRYSVARPVLFSKEVAQTLGAEEGHLPPATIETRAPNPKSEQVLQALLRDAVDPAVQAGMEMFDYRSLLEPQVTPRPHGLAALREIIAEEGLSTIADYGVMSPRQMARALQGPGAAELEKFYGTRIQDWKNLPKGLNQVPGVVLHPSGVGEDVPPLNRVRGAANPHLGWGMLNLILADRVLEFRALDAIWPGCIARSESYADVVEEGALSEELLTLRSTMEAQVNDMVLAGRTPTPDELAELRAGLSSLVNRFLSEVQHRYTMGAFIKNFGESTTGDLGNQITSFHYNVDNIVDQYLSHLKNLTHRFPGYAQAAASAKTSVLSVPSFREDMGSNYYATGTKFLDQLLADPSQLLAQERIKIAKTDLGFNREIRVDFVDGEPVSAHSRFSHEFSREDEEEAKAVIQKIFERAPEEFHYLSGGADVARLEDGSWKVIELNPGSYSGSIAVHTFPIETNRFVSELQGFPSPLIAELEEVARGSPDTRRAYLKALTTEEELWNKRSLKELSIAEVARYLRDRALDGWREDPTPEHAAQVLADLRAAFDGVGSPNGRDLSLLIRGAENYLFGKLGQTIAVPNDEAQVRPTGT
jgi:hypothetical protein